MSWNTLLQEFKTYKFPLYPLFLLLQDSIPANEVSLLKVNGLIKAGLHRCRLIVHIITIEGITHLKSQCIAATKTCRLNPIFFTLLHNGIPYTWSNHRRQENLITPLACKTCPRNVCVHSSKASFYKVLQPDSRQINISQFLQYF